MNIADTLEVFPSCPSYGYEAQPLYLVRIIEREGGYERRDRRWSRPLLDFVSVPMGNRTEADAYEILSFWHAMGGTASAFRFKDWSDYKSCALSADVSPLDQPFEVISGSPGGYQLIKEYTAGSTTQVRDVIKPYGDTIRVANDSGIEQDSAYWSLDESTGILEPLTGFSGIPTSWGGEFYCKARFSSQLRLEIVEHRIQRVDFAVRELRGAP